MRTGERGGRRQAGFTYLGLVIALAIIGLAGAATLKVDALLRRAAAEQALLETGAAFSAALKSYADATPPGQPTQPPSLRELLKDPRVPGVRRHLRKLFVDPITGKVEWGIVWRDPDSRTGVLAVYSLSRAKPLKQANFDGRFQHLENRDHLSEWRFAALGQGVAQPQPTPQSPSAAEAQQPSLFAAPAQPPSVVAVAPVAPSAAVSGDDARDPEERQLQAGDGQDEE